MTRGVVFYNKGTKCLIRMSVSIYTLRRCGYAGDICVIHEGDLPDWFRAESESRGCTFVRIPDEHCVDWALVQKASLWRYTPFDTSLFIDSDTVVMKDPSVLFPQIEEHGFAVTKFSDWTTNGGGIMRGRVNGWRSIIGDEMTDKALAYGPALNTGVFGWVKGHPILPAWESLTRAGHAHGEKDGPATRIIDETACQVLAPMYPHTALDRMWNRSIKHDQLPVEETGITHFHGGKHTGGYDLCYLWLDAYWELRNKSAHYEELGDAQGDRRLEEFVLPKQRRDLTVCCAADEKYAPKLYRHFVEWMKTPGLREQRLIVFCVNSDIHGEPWDKFHEWSNVEFVAYESSSPTPRERAFEAFVFGTARRVKTPYWMKLDGDAHMTGPEFLWPDYTKATITADRWHFTKVKGDDGAKQHWLNTLDEWWGGEPMFPKIEGRRHKHRRLRSYCWIENIEFTRWLAEKCGNRLPVPSHDTTAWYAATRAGKTLQEHAFREYIVA